MKVTKVFKCPECDEIVAKADLVEAFQCGECGEVYDDLDEAKECCKE